MKISTTMGENLIQKQRHLQRAMPDQIRLGREYMDKWGRQLRGQASLQQGLRPAEKQAAPQIDWLQQGLRAAEKQAAPQIDWLQQGLRPAEQQAAPQI